ncbi:glycine zipper 2TM domain-containing protein [Hydrogenophaga sp.]|uniref:glycine zipper 2TM domain-containing protein n=1 Tax=Hydrogenophaga sp. TaxID=1904254 RepID=UPI0025BFC0CB|nr:glycine zipper 2TM domain-containing protein [Hydrogenophaga sp.]
MAGLLALGGAGAAQAQEAQGRVLSSTPVVQQVAVPRQVCQNEQVSVQGRKSGAGALMGGIAGGAIGNAVGNGGGRAAATVIGVLGGAILGDRIEGGSPSYTETVRNCGTQTLYENRTVAYDVVYEYAGQQYNVQMPKDPGRFVRLSVTPVDALPPPAPRYAPQARAEYQVPYEDDRAPVTRVVIGTHYIPTYPVAPRVVWVNGYRPGQWYAGQPRHWREDNRRERQHRREERRDNDDHRKWQRH